MGKAKNLKKRVSSYFQNKGNLGPKTSLLVETISKLEYIRVDSEVESLLLEARLIKKYNPRFNSRLTDGKSYPYIRISKEQAPKVFIVRRDDEPKAIHFGPFPNPGSLYLVLKTARRIFPFQSVRNHPKRYCLYYHLGLCPCPPMFTTDEQKKDYQKNIKRLIKFLDGKSEILLKELGKERDLYAKSENFEKSQEIQDQIIAIQLVTQPVTPVFSYEDNIDLRSDLRAAELEELKKILKENGVMVKKLERIECFDISNTSGQLSTGSMVVLQNGEKDSSSYRRFKIKFPPKVIPNDFAMMAEVIERRVKRNDWPHPDLIIVDGGKGQISSAHKVLKKLEKEIPLIGIAKREETLITTDFKEIKIPKSSPALKLVMRIRDEAHRFAITYHRKLRSNFIFS